MVLLLLYGSPFPIVSMIARAPANSKIASLIGHALYVIAYYEIHFWLIFFLSGLVFLLTLIKLFRSVTFYEAVWNAISLLIPISFICAPNSLMDKIDQTSSVEQISVQSPIILKK